MFQTSVGLLVSKKGNLIGKCEIAGKDKVIAISKSTQKKLCSNLSDIASGTAVASEVLKKCFVTLCRAKGKNHWLITKDQMQRINVNIDVDRLLLIWERNGLEKAVTAFQYCIEGGNLNDFWTVANHNEEDAMVNQIVPVELPVEDEESITNQLSSVDLDDGDPDSFVTLFTF